MPFNFQQEQQGALQVLRGGIEEKKGEFWGENKRKRGQRGDLEEALVLLSEPRSVLDRRRSSSPRTSTSTLSSSLGGGGYKWPPPAVAAAEEEARKDDWTAELPPIPAFIGSNGSGVEDWNSVLPGSAASAGQGQDQSFFGWVMGDCDDDTNGLKSRQLMPQDLSFDLDSEFGTAGLQPSFSIGGVNDVSVSVQAQHQQQMHPQLNHSFLLSFPQFAAVHDEIQLPSPQNHQFPLFPGYPNPLQHQPQFVQHNVGQFHPQLKAAKSKVAPVNDSAAIPLMAEQQHAFVDQLFQAAELVEARNFVSALAILTRLNQQLPSPVGKPIVRTAFYFKEALQLLATNGVPPNPLPATNVVSPVDVVFKLGAYKAFSDVSPVVQFTNFTCIQAMLEELGNAERIHIIDFDIGIGGLWSSFMQELAARHSSVTMAVPMLKITAFVLPGSHHNLELHLTRENLCEFARGLNIPFEFNVLSLEPTNASLFLGLFPGTNEAIAVNLPIGSVSHTHFPTLLRMVKQLSPKILISIEHGLDRSDLPFSHHFLNAFQSCNVLLDSIDAAGSNQDSTTKIERFFVQPRIEKLVLGHHLSVDKMLPWRSLFSNTGFISVQFSNFTETQAECILKRVQVRGFHIEKRQTSLCLCWQRGDLVSVSAWKC